IKSAKNGAKFFGTSVVVCSSSTYPNWLGTLANYFDSVVLLLNKDMIMYSYERNHGSLMEFKDGLDMATMGFILDDNKKLKRLLIVFAERAGHDRFIRVMPDTPSAVGQ
ncbi:hypothetical protein Tco_1038497, partial [Tanacetum coccineum]